MKIGEDTFISDVGFVSSADRRQIDAITVGALDNYLFDEVWPQTTSIFTLPGKIRLCASPHKALTGAAASQPKIACVSSMERFGRHFRGRRGRCLADTDLTMVERLGAARNADS